MIEIVTSQEWASRAEIEAMIEAIRAWGERPDAFLGWLYCAAVGWISEER